MTIRELIPPYREARIAIVLHALEIAWLKERGDVTIREDLIYSGDNVIARIICDRPRFTA